MSYILTNFAHGNGPYCRAIDRAIEFNKNLKQVGEEEKQIIVPLVYGDRQKRIMNEEFGRYLIQNPNVILLDEKIGSILNDLYFHGNNYEQSLETLAQNGPKFAEEINEYIKGKMSVQNMTGKPMEIDGDNIAVEISHNPRFPTDIKKSYYSTIVPLSELLTRTIDEQGLNFNEDILKNARDFAYKIENSQALKFMPEPFTFSYVPNRKRALNEFFSPPGVHIPEINNEKVAEGMYAMITGIPGLRNLFNQINQFGMKIYCPPFIRDIENADNSHAPDFISNPNIKYQFGRSGWSTVWLSHMTETPFITPAYKEGDDPEIYFNEKTIKKLNLGIIFDESKNPKDVLKDADNLINPYRALNNSLIKKFGTLDGIVYEVERMSNDFLGRKNILETEPILQARN